MAALHVTVRRDAGIGVFYTAGGTQMKVHRAYVATLSGKLTCSEVMQLLMEQPTQPQGRGMESHAHMHTMEGFTPQAAGFGGDAFSLERKQFHYQTPTHLYPAGT